MGDKVLRWSRVVLVLEPVSLEPLFGLFHLPDGPVADLDLVGAPVPAFGQVDLVQVLFRLLVESLVVDAVEDLVLGALALLKRLLSLAG